jgi:Mg2+-importing ATPase
MASLRSIKQTISEVPTGHKPQILDFDCAECTPEVLYQKFGTSDKGLTDKEAKKRISEYGYNEPAKKKQHGIPYQIMSKFFNPLVFILVIIACFSFFFGEMISAIIVLAMIVLSVFLSFFQEYRSSKEVEKLMEMVKTTATIYRNGKPKEVNIREIVPGDVVDLFAGDMIPADLRIMSCKDLFINQATLTGESIPVEKNPKPAEKKASSISEMNNIAFMGSSVVSGTGLGIVVKTGVYTQFGELSKRLATMQVETSFDKGVNQFTWVMIRAMIVMVVVILGVNLFINVKEQDFGKRLIDALMFSLAVAVGLTPEMLPLIITINLSKGAAQMSKKKVIVKRLNSIQNFGAMDVLCTDKTGTLTMDRVVLEQYCDVMRQESKDVLKYACVNSYYQTGLKNILDRAILKYVNKEENIDITSYKKIDEMPFDFSRRIMSVVVEMEGKTRLISKGAPEEIYKRCTKYELDGDIMDMEYLILADLKNEYERLSADGFRVLALAYKDIDVNKDGFTKDDEAELVLKGYVAFLDPPKASARRATKVLPEYGINIKVLTGDNELVTKKICSEVGLDVHGLVTGDMLETLGDIELRALVEKTTVFARLSPIQKEKVIHALHANGHIVGFMGDGINDALALKAADVGISVNNAVDIAKESADIILLEKNLSVLEDGVIEGRRTFGNITKYIKMASSSNFGNMLSMTGASLFLPFLPMTPIQVLLNNFLYDLSQTSIPTDQVDDDYLLTPRPWNIKSIQRFMFFIGPVSSIFDFMTFAVMLFIFKCTTATQDLFHTGWFVESLVSQTLVIYVIRTIRTPVLESKPSRFLVLTSLLIVAFGLTLPLTPFGAYFGFVVPPAKYFLILEGMMAAYLILVYFVQQWFVKKFGRD